jgi:DNA replicative helicase MCM subunit Mcm2 (Cdc46/Mcm family)
MGERDEESLSTEEIYEEMEVLEPYTAGELASHFDAPKQRIRNLLERLAKSGKIRKKEPESTRAIWIREAPVHECSDCGYKYEVKFLHPIFSAVQFCPHCGNQL